MINLQYFYAVLDENNCCGGVITSSYEVPFDNYILIDSLNEDYCDKYYSYTTKKWYYDAACTQEVVELNG